MKTKFQLITFVFDLQGTNGQRPQHEVDRRMRKSPDRRQPLLPGLQGIQKQQLAEVNFFRFG
jgi:NADH:ubiquinone oxidoreductase subunit E